MPRVPKTIFNRTTLIVTTRTEEGLPLVATSYMRAIIESILARAQQLHPVQVCHYLFMGNHLHMIVRVDNPQDVPAFVNRIKTETAHAINRLLGREKRRIWSEGYDSPALLTAEDVIDKIVYIYTNPQRAGLVDKIEEYPGANSWEMFMCNNTTKSSPWIHRPAIPALSRKPMGVAEQEALKEQLLSGAKQEHLFTLRPYGWLDCFKIPESEIPIIKRKIASMVRAVEAELRGRRKLKNKHVLGKKTLMLQSPFKEYVPKTYGRRMICISQDVELRKRFIEYVKHLFRKGREVFESWRAGDLTVPFPSGLFPPSLPVVSNLIPAAVAGL
jgi:REP element-mobilizing transposase RayT